MFRIFSSGEEGSRGAGGLLLDPPLFIYTAGALFVNTLTLFPVFVVVPSRSMKTQGTLHEHFSWQQKSNSLKEFLFVCGKESNYCILVELIRKGWNARHGRNKTILTNIHIFSFSILCWMFNLDNGKTNDGFNCKHILVVLLANENIYKYFSYKSHNELLVFHFCLCKVGHEGLRRKS